DAIEVGESTVCTNAVRIKLGGSYKKPFRDCIIVRDTKLAQCKGRRHAFESIKSIERLFALFLSLRGKDAGLDRSSNFCSDGILIDEAGAQSLREVLCPNMETDAAINQTNDQTRAIAHSSQSTNNQVADAQSTYD